MGEPGGRATDHGHQRCSVSGDEITDAANDAASRFSKAGKQASAKFYAAKAKELRQQLD